MKKINLLNLVVVIVGVAIIFLGLNVGLGGIRTLGWQTTRDFVAITDAAIFHTQDSHIRFIGGIWFGVGATFLIGGFALRTFRPTLIILSAMIAIAGLFRLSGMDSGAIFSAAIAPSISLELIGFPLLAWWLVVSKNVRGNLNT
ncbi:DUF4345 domain-containing protein [Sulfitobacter sp. SK012]|uniref:DUF4345 family protein n=1 Tax=Sulfitobacter sp. SK012 TaxID=1389005 RepID=UPI000E0BE53C|nr:DUF4345 family protein [Sulfitobacter sp. SK012]AXI46476.1 DUF4345 domain-containing protein [Sulfitobacter sp. SK012]